MKKPATTPLPGDPSPALMRALARLLRPLVRVLIAQGIMFPALIRLLKEVYVDVAEADFPVAGKQQTDSRLSLLTGLHRKDVKALRALRRGTHHAERASALLSRNAHMIALWTGAPAYVDARGAPRPLPSNKPRKGGPSFEALVGSVSKDIRSRAVLDEWQRLGLVSVDSKDTVHLNTDAFVPREEFADLAFYFGRNLHDHIAASGHNLLGNDPPMLERAVYYEKLTAAAVEELAALSRKAGSEALLKVNQRAFELSRQDADDKGGGAKTRMSFGVYFYAGDDSSDDAEG